MKNPKILLLSLSLTALGLLSACSESGKMHSDLVADRDHEHENDFYMAAPAQGKADQDPLRRKLSHFFLVEQFNVAANASMLQAIQNNPPGGILFWNGNSANAQLVRDSIKAYSHQAQLAGLKPLLFSTDYEGGARRKTPSGGDVPGVQRFTKGFTSLAHPRWLGVSLKPYGTELCALHGKIMAQELKAVGLNYPLSVVADLATQPLTSVRAISKNAEEASLCVNKILEQFVKTKDLVFVTKHFPGLGLTRGDTHDQTVVAPTKDPATLEAHLKPFLNLVNFSKTLNADGLLSVMTTHAKFLGYDENNLTTESSATVSDVLKGQLKFRGLVVSDAMWMGEYGTLKSAKLMPVYLNSFLSGIDLLMIPGSRFAESVNYFRKVYDGALTNEEKSLLTARTGMSWEETHAKFISRISQSLKTQELVRGSILPAHTYVQDVVPTTLTTTDRARYEEILGKLVFSNQ